MTAAILSSKGQITIPLAVRDAMKLTQGDRIEFVEVAPGRYEVMAATKSIKDLRGMLPPPTQPLSIDAMNAMIASRGATAG